ncbi:MAG: nitroreductase family protein [Synergistaceae bacterium]|nr:nitroreductase family protein [Synergistaceae bacterium]
MDVLTAIKERFSVREYSDRKVEPEKLDAVLEVAMRAPTAVNFQPQRIYVMESQDALSKVKANSKFYFDSPVVLLVCYDKGRAAQIPHMPEGNSGVMDASIVCDEMMLAAWEQGLGSCWVVGFDPEGMARAFNLPENVKPAVLLFLGYAAEGCKPFRFHNETKPLAELVTRL